MKSFIVSLGIIFLAFSNNVYAETKPVPKVNCELKKNQKKIECKEAPKSNVKVEIKKPEKVTRKAPKSVQKKAEEKLKE